MISHTKPEAPKMKNLVILGAGGFAREAFSWIHPGQYQVIGFYTETEGPNDIFDTQVTRSLHGFPFDTHFLVAVGDPRTRSRLFEKAMEAKLVPSIPIIGPGVIVGRDIQIGQGSIVCPGTVITCNVVIDPGSLINLNCTIGHDCHIGAFSTLSPGVNLSGNVHVGSHCYLGTNSSVREKIRIGNESVLGMGSVLIKDLPDGETWAGIPAKRLQ